MINLWMPSKLQHYFEVKVKQSNSDLSIFSCKKLTEHEVLMFNCLSFHEYLWHFWSSSVCFEEDCSYSLTFKVSLWVPQSLNYLRFFFLFFHHSILLTLPWPISFSFSPDWNSALQTSGQTTAMPWDCSCVNCRHHSFLLSQFSNSLISKTDIGPLRLWMILIDRLCKFSSYAQKHFQRLYFPGQKVLSPF